ncbi:MAG: (Fe-S)-binding protein [Chloroflexota bacterium]
MDAEELYEAILRCNKCGFCQANCPVYKELLEESACARGRLRLFRAVLEGEQGLSDSYVKKLDRCTGCMACTASCPSGVGPLRMILAARAYNVGNKGLPRLKSLALRNVLSHEGVHGLAFAAASYAQRLGLTHLAPGRLVPPGIDLNHFPLSASPFRSQVAEVVSPVEPKGRVGFFVGCMIDHSLPNVGHATVRVLNRLGFEVVIPKGLKCCGIPLIFSGDVETARSLAEHNLRILSELPVDHIVTSCASCGNGIKNEYRELFKDGELAESAERVAAKALDISVFLASRIEPGQLGEVERLTMTYHDPCHLARGQGITAEPRQLMRAVPGVEFREMVEADRCCGAGGTFQVFFPDVAWAITRRKLENIKAADAQTVITACPACLQRLQGGLRQTGMPQSTLHIVELLDRALAVASPRHTVETQHKVAVE